MTEVFHESELAVQARAGVSVQAQMVGRIIAPHLPDGADGYLAGLPILFHGGVDAQGAVWASALTGDPGFIHVIDAHTVEVRANPVPGNPLSTDTIPEAPGDPGAPAGFLAIDLSTRQRFRFNGDATRTGDTLRVKINQAYGNCPKYIQRREVTAPGGAPGSAPGSDPPQEAGPTVTDTTLSDEDVDLIHRADTFFIASTAGGHGADVSHRGGAPGFVGVTPQGNITFKDYPGNNMFQTLGNLTSDPRAGLLFIDFKTGSTLQLSGRAEVHWATKPPTDTFETGRTVTFMPERVVRTPRAVPLRWVLKEYSPFNPDEKQALSENDLAMKERRV